METKNRKPSDQLPSRCCYESDRTGSQVQDSAESTSEIFAQQNMHMEHMHIPIIFMVPAESILTMVSSSSLFVYNIIAPRSCAVNRIFLFFAIYFSNRLSFPEKQMYTGTETAVKFT